MSMGEHHGSKARKVNKAKRNFRIGGQDRGASPNHATQTKYVRSGGPARCEARKARNVAKRQALTARRLARLEAAA